MTIATAAVLVGEASAHSVPTVNAQAAGWYWSEYRAEKSLETHRWPDNREVAYADCVGMGAPKSGYLYHRFHCKLIAYTADKQLVEEAKQAVAFAKLAVANATTPLAKQIAQGNLAEAQAELKAALRDRSMRTTIYGMLSVEGASRWRFR